MKTKWFILICLFLLSQDVVSQFFERGLPFITNYLPTQTGGSEQNWAVVQDKRGIMYFGNNDKGVLEYDGVNWRSIPISNNSIVRSLTVDEKGTVYAGAVGEFGYLTPDQLGKLEYASLSQRLDSAERGFTDVWKTFAHNEQVYFCSEEYTYIYHVPSDSLHVITNEPGTFMSHLVEGRLYHSNLLHGLLVQEGEKTELVPGGEYFVQKYVTCILPLSGDAYFIGTALNGACLFEPATGRVDTTFVESSVNALLKENTFYQGILLGGGKLGISTLFGGGGFLILDEQGRLIQQFNKQSGLQDETILYAYVNPENRAQSPLWLALNIGISKAEINSPIRFFNERSGLNGTINDIIRFNGILYVATSSGIYYQKENPDRTVTFEKVENISTQCWDFTVFNPPGGRASRLFIATITGLCEIRGVRALLLDPGILDRTHKSYYLFTHMQSQKDPSLFYLAGETFITLKHEGNRFRQVDEIDLQDDIRSIEEDDLGDLWLGTSRKGVTRIRITEEDTIIRNFSVEDGLPTADRNFVYYIDGELYVATSEGICRYDNPREVFYKDTVMGAAFHETGAAVFRVMKDKQDRFWVSYEKEGQYREAIVRMEGDSVNTDLLPFHRLPNKSTDAFYDGEETVWFGKSTELYRFYDQFDKDYHLPFHSLVRQVTLSMDSIVFYGTGYRMGEDGRRIISLDQNEELIPTIKYSYNNFMCRVSAPFFENEGATLYRFWLEGSDHGWTHWSERDEFPRTNLRPRHYRLHVQAKNVYGVESSVSTYEFTVLPPWYRTIFAYIGYVILLIVLIVVIVKLYTRRLVKENIKLEGIIAERTAEIRRQKEELEDSIEYASRIQQALLPSRQILREELPEHFILFKPRDIVSGDFYWMGKQDGKVVVVAADCTGHGVPGAFMSMLGISFLNEVVNTLRITEPNLILDELRVHVMESLKQTGEAEDETKDGMDLALMVIDRESRKLRYSGAYNPLYYVRPLSEKEKAALGRGEEIDLPDGALHNGKHILEQLKADKMPIGISVKRLQPFTMHEIDLNPGYSIYINSDGYVDQFGGPAGKKFMSKSFKKLLLDIQDIPMQDQGKILNEKLLDWQGDHPQLDDIIVIGIQWKNSMTAR